LYSSRKEKSGTAKKKKKERLWANRNTPLLFGLASRLDQLNHKKNFKKLLLQAKRERARGNLVNIFRSKQIKLPHSTASEKSPKSLIGLFPIFLSINSVESHWKLSEIPLETSESSLETS